LKLESLLPHYLKPKGASAIDIVRPELA